MRRQCTLGLWAAAAAVFLALGGCEPVEFGSQPVTPEDTAAGESLLSIANLKRTDSGDLEFLLFKPAIQDIEGAAPSEKFEPIPFGMYRTVKVKPGRWKIGYRDEAGNLEAMPAETDGLDEEWPVMAFAKGKSYQLLVETDEGNNTIWRTNIPEAK